MQEREAVVWGGFTNCWEKKRNENHGKNGKIYPTECSVAENSRERERKGLFKWTIQKGREKQKNGKDSRSLQENEEVKEIFHARIDTIKDRNSMA